LNQGIGLSFSDYSSIGCGVSTGPLIASQLYQTSAYNPICWARQCRSLDWLRFGMFVPGAPRKLVNPIEALRVSRGELLIIQGPRHCSGVV